MFRRSRRRSRSQSVTAAGQSAGPAAGPDATFLLIAGSDGSTRSNGAAARLSRVTESVRGRDVVAEIFCSRVDGPYDDRFCGTDGPDIYELAGVSLASQFTPTTFLFFPSDSLNLTSHNRALL